MRTPLHYPKGVQKRGIHTQVENLVMIMLWFPGNVNVRGSRGSTILSIATPGMCYASIKMIA